MLCLSWSLSKPFAKVCQKTTKVAASKGKSYEYLLQALSVGVESRNLVWQQIVTSHWQHSLLQISVLILLLFRPQREKTRLRELVNNKGADQPAHPRSLISAFVIRWL